ncbi:MAG: hypothetical protein E6J42_12160 [Chloroflexi bacterium]|nr:MAG: hypothetical protein E6J42_12160 [Chloroflexota bacterium]
MIDFTGSELYIRVALEDKARETRELRRRPRALSTHPSLRARIAARLAGLALKLDREAAGRTVTRDLRAAGRSS